MMIVCANSKGGVGKSTIAAHLSVWLSEQGFRTALLDCDKQRSSSQWIAEVEAQIAIRASSDPEECLLIARELAASHDFVVADAPGGLEDISRTLLILADFAVFPISPSILDIRSVVDATKVLRYAQTIRGGKPEGRLVFNKMKTRGKGSRQLVEEAPSLGCPVALNVIRDLQAYVEAPLQGTVVSRLGRPGASAAKDIARLFVELFGETIARMRTEQHEERKVENG